MAKMVQETKKSHANNRINNNRANTKPTTNLQNVPTKDDLWKNADTKALPDNAGWIVEMTGLDSKSHTVYARAVKAADYTDNSNGAPSVRVVVDSVVDIAWKHVAKHILEAKAKSGNNKETAAGDASAEEEILMVDLDHFNQGAFPPADQLLELGAVWLVNETSYLQHQHQQLTTKNQNHNHHPHTKKKRLTSSQDDGNRQPDWADYVLRIHYAPNRFHAMAEVDWGKYCRGLLLGDQSVQIFLKGKSIAACEHVPLSGYPDKKDGVIVYEDADHGFAILNKPGTVPDHATVNNHAEDVLSVFTHILQERGKQSKKEEQEYSHHNHYHDRAAHLSLPFPLDTETQGLVIIATKRLFRSYLVDMVEHKQTTAIKKEIHQPRAIVKKYKCLVCIKRPEDMMILNDLQESKAVVTHYYHHNPNHKNHATFVTEIPMAHHHEYGKSAIRLLTIGTNHGLYAANVTSETSVGDAHLAHRLWGLGVQNSSTTPAEDLGISYVAQLEFEQLVQVGQLHTHLHNASRLTPQQLICGQFAALGFPLVGDSVHGGGTSEVWGGRHGWNRLALQCCEWSFPQPHWNAHLEPSPASVAPDKEKDNREVGWTTVPSGKHHHHEDRKEGDHPSGKRQLVASTEDRCVFRLNESWWTPLLDEYHVEGFPM